jgi:apolipoprotein D and lipocalin family protein
MGDWYIIASIPTPFEEEATNAVISYHWNPAERNITVEYHHNEGDAEGPLRHLPQKAWISDPQTNAEWKTQFLWPMKFTYRILEVASDYSWSLVGTASQNFVWILARSPHLETDVLQMLLEKLEGWGYDLDKIRKVPQIWNQVS